MIFKQQQPMRFRLIPHRLFLSFLIYYKLGVFAVFLVCAYQEEVHICGYAEAAVATEAQYNELKCIKSLYNMCHSCTPKSTVHVKHPLLQHFVISTMLYYMTTSVF